jgi:hypothetical protein
VTFRTILLPFAAAALVAGCGGSTDASVAGNKFPDTERSSFLAGCEDSGGSVSACECVITAVEQRWSFDEFKVIMQRVQADGRPTAELAQLSAGCAQPA